MADIEDDFDMDNPSDNDDHPAAIGQVYNTKEFAKAPNVGQKQSEEADGGEGEEEMGSEAKSEDGEEQAASEDEGQVAKSDKSKESLEGQSVFRGFPISLEEHAGARLPRT